MIVRPLSLPGTEGALLGSASRDGLGGAEDGLADCWRQGKCWLPLDELRPLPLLLPFGGEGGNGWKLF